MKILIVKTVPGEINTEKLTYNIQEIGLAKALIRQGNQCDIVCCSDSVESTKVIKIDEKHDINVYCMKAIKILKNGFIRGIDKIISEKQYDILHVSEYNQLFTWHLSKKYKNKMIVYHGPYYHEFNKRYNLMSKVFDKIFLNRYLKLNTKFLTKSNLAKEFLQSKGITNVETIGVGIDRKMLFNDSEGDIPDFINRIKEEKAFKIMYIGRIEERRNSKFLLDILKRLKEQNENIKLVIVGKGNKKYTDEFWEKADQLNLRNDIIYKEDIEQKYNNLLYKHTDLFVLPTRYDIFGMVILEAMFFKKVVITTNNGGSNMLIDNNESGIIIDNFDTDKWVEQILKIKSNIELKKKIEELANKQIEDNFTWDKLASKFYNAYCEVLDHK